MNSEHSGDEAGSSGILTAPLPRPLVTQIEAFIRRCADKPIMNLFDSAQIINEAKAIAALLPAVDADLLEARKIASVTIAGDEQGVLDGGYDSSGYVDCALRGIRRGRALSTPSQEHRE
jgi:hypothetical protein